jgi:hypothetical protein
MGKIFAMGFCVTLNLYIIVENKTVETIPLAGAHLKN